VARLPRPIDVLPGRAQNCFKLTRIVFAYSQATVPLVTVITRKAFGGRQWLRLRLRTAWSSLGTA
jgi:hypothetical protein